jgi:hypothetical protein
LLAGINKIWSYVDEVKTTNEIAQLSQACEAFKAHYGRYPPGRIALARGMDYPNIAQPVNDARGQLERESVEYLMAIFPGIDPRSGMHDWTGQGVDPITFVPLGQPGVYYLEGQEALVFFLGGLHYGTSGFVGFCTDSTRPTLNNLNIAGAQRTRPFFDFDMSRIAVGPATDPNATNFITNNCTGSADPVTGPSFAVFLDPYKTPYAYFSARAGASNNYSTLANISVWVSGGFNFPDVLLDCNRLITLYQPPGANNTGTRFPYFQNQNGNVATYHRGSSFQIVSAGKDRMFGDNTGQNPLGNLWVANSSNGQLTPEALDNITNFSGGVLVPK